MKRTTYYLLIPMALLSISLNAHGQETMTSGISYPYLNKLIDIAIAKYPDLKVREYQVKAAKNNITRVAVGYLDAFSASYYYRPTQAIDVNNPNLFNGYQIGINVNIGSLVQRPFIVKDAKAQYKIAQLQETSYHQNLVAEVKKRYFAYQEQLAQLKLRSKSLSDAQSLVKQLRFKFEKSEASFDDLTRALLLSSEQNQFLITAEGGTFAAKAALEELLGDTLENIKPDGN
ncbi:MAG: TolC family protein [Flavobacterium sp.]|nr:MAG: TolC family protein [Flavobacterium sp.]